MPVTGSSIISSLKVFWSILYWTPSRPLSLRTVPSILFEGALSSLYGDVSHVPLSKGRPYSLLVPSVGLTPCGSWQGVQRPFIVVLSGGGYPGKPDNADDA